MKTIGVIGMGRMGQMVCSLMDSRRDLKCIPFQRIQPDNQSLLQECDVAIEFTIPEAAPGVIRHCLEHNIPIVSGTTGWHEHHLQGILTLCTQRQGSFLYATNFSIGMNIVFALNHKLALLLTRYPEFKASVKEIHHVHKKDSPSGTAYTLMDDILLHHPEYSGFVLNPNPNDLDEHKLPITAVREGDVKGYHQVTWDSGSEQLTIIHEAFDRKIFAEGALIASEWLSDQPPGVYTMKDIISL